MFVVVVVLVGMVVMVAVRLSIETPSLLSSTNNSNRLTKHFSIPVHLYRSLKVSIVLVEASCFEAEGCHHRDSDPGAEYVLSAVAIQATNGYERIHYSCLLVLLVR